MLRKYKIRTFFFVALLLLVVVSVVCVALYSDHLAKLAVENVGSEAFGVETRMRSAHVSVLGGVVKLFEFEIGNPPGYHGDCLLDIQKCSAEVDIGSLFADTIVVNVVRLEGLVLRLEQKGLTSNLREVLDSLGEFQSDDGGKSSNELSGGSLAARRILVNRIEIPDATLKMKLLLIGGKLDVVTVKAGPIVIEGVSGDTDEAMLALEIFRKTFADIVFAVVTDAAVDLPSDLSGVMLGTITGISGAASGVTDRILYQVDRLLRQGGKEIDAKSKEILDRVGQIFRRRKEED